MKIAILSGKGGTGKTFITTNLAASVNNATYIDCDVEAPNGYLFLKPDNKIINTIKVKIPRVDKSSCTGCRKCVDFCRFNALAYIYNRLFIFEEICHSCGGCILLCPNDALTEIDKSIGEIQIGISDTVNVFTGLLNVGESSGMPIITKLLEYADTADISFIDCPPGSSCNVLETARNSDYCIIIAEPTIFSVHNLNMVYNLVTLLKKPCGVIINKSFEDNQIIEDYCHEKNLKIITKIPYDQELSTINAKGELAVRVSDKYKIIFNNIMNKIIEATIYETTTNSKW